jgi:hypothetical protein
MLILVRNEGRPKFHIDKVSLGYFYCNVEFCIGHGRGILNARVLISYYIF